MPWEKTRPPTSLDDHRGGTGPNGRYDHGSSTGGPVLVGANWYRFAASEHIRHPLVASLCFVWTVQGTGRIRSGGREFEMSPNSVLRLPWRHAVEYLPNPRSPFSLGTIHVVPWHDLSVPVEIRPPFLPGDPLLDAVYRRDAESGHTAELLPSRSVTARNIIGLGTYAIDRFHEGPVSESTCRALGRLITDENARWNTAGEPEMDAPAALKLMTDFIAANISEHLSVAKIAAAGDCSTVTAERLFTRYTGLPVLAWVRARRMERAATLLRTSSLRPGEVARMVGFSDPLYFSRVFRATYSVPPSRYATNQLRP